MSVWFPAGVEAEATPCNRCGSAQERLLFEGPDRLHHLAGNFRVVECVQCGWLRQNPRPTEQTIQYYYPSDYVNFVLAIEDEPTPWRRWDRRYGMIKRRRVVERFQRRGRLLDVGCATGLFLHEMERSGWEVAGIEPSEGAADYARARFGLVVHVGTLGQVSLPDGDFDAITLWDVFEHLHSPWSDLQKAHALLREDGLLLLRIPNLESLGRRLFGRTWLGWDLPRHLYFVPQAAMVTALEEIGFELAGTACLATSHFALLLSLRFWLEERYTPAARWPHTLDRALRSAPARLAMAPVLWGIDQARASSMITLLARKTHRAGGRA